MKTLLKTKAAQGHVEMILSFAIFIGFVVVMLIFLNPIRQQKITYASVDIAENKILDNVSFSYSYIGLILVNSIDSGCFSIENIPDQSGRVIVKNTNDHIVPSVNDYSSTPKKIYITAAPATRFYKLYFSDKLNNYSSGINPASCLPLARENYSFGPLYLDKAVLFSNLPLLADSYNADYTALKDSMNLVEDFEFVVYDLNRNILSGLDTTAMHNIKTTLVLSRDLPLRVLDKDANPSDIILNIRVW